MAETGQADDSLTDAQEASAYAGESAANGLLLALPHRAYSQLAPHLEVVAMSTGQRLGPPNEHTSCFYFPESAVISILKRMRDGREIEVGTVGNEGMTGLAVLLGGAKVTTEYVVQIAGTARRAHTKVIQAAWRRAGPLHDTLSTYAQYAFAQSWQSVACSSLHTLEQRCARWLLATTDRIGDTTFELTHNQLAKLLGVRRASISVVAETLKRLGAIEYVPGAVRIVDRTTLEAITCECYQEVRDEFERLLGKQPAMGMRSMRSGRTIRPDES